MPTKPTPISNRVLARALTLSPAAVAKCKAKGMPMHSVAAARAWRAVNVRPKVQAAAPATISLDRARYEAAEAERAELLVARLRSKLVSRDTVQAAVQDAYRALRDRLDEVPGRCAPVLVGLADMRQVELVIEDALRQALTTPEDSVREPN